MKVITDVEKIKSFENKLSEIITTDWYDFDTSYLERMNWLGVPIGEDAFYWEDNSFDEEIQDEEIQSAYSDEQYDQKDITKSFLSLISAGVVNKLKKVATALKFTKLRSLRAVKPGEPESLYQNKFAKLVKEVIQGDCSGIKVPIFLKVLKEEGYSNYYVLIESFPPDNCFELEIKEEDISNLDYEFRPSCYAIFPKDISFIILQADDYSIIAGNKDFIEKVFDCTIERAMKSFRDEMTIGWAKAEDGTQNSMEILYLELYEKYKSHNEKVLRKLGEG